ncbi:MAG: hypothetical protein CMH13_24105 [Martelella sp.]|uniref:LysR family transcriptional regulator n=1 Tax=unclassified Martelella TaxID=2629616 RepID=UPI000C6BE3F3|nr:hypothetical protein [Martelella sp.]
MVGAAEIVGRTPPALTKAVDRLESDLYVSLLTRTGRGVSPTPAGLFLLEQTRGLAGSLPQCGSKLLRACSRKRTNPPFI